MKKNLTQIAFAVAAMLSFSTTMTAQLTVDATPTPSFLVTNVLLGTGVTASGITYTGDATARGSFNGTASNIGFTSGVILAAGDINNAVGPNNSSSQTTAFGTTSTDPELSSIATASVNDAAILEFDFVPTSDSLKFRYVFASEEYLEFVGSTFNDVFGFFISGPNPAGGTYTNQNIAIIPGTASTAVSINNVNSTSFPGYYFDNGDGIAGGTPVDGATVQYDGFTTPLTARAAVICGQTYHIKIAIADVGDAAYDSGVFLEAGSFSSQGVNIIPTISYGGTNDSTLYEGCGQACIYFVRTSNLANADTINVTIGGTATNGVDYNTGVAGAPLPTQLFFAAGQDSLQYCINAVNDGTIETTESVLLSILQTGPCIATTTNATVFIAEHSILSVSVNDTAFCNSGGTANLFADVSGGVEPYTYTWSGGLPSIPNPTVSVTTTTNYVITVNDACTGAPDPTPASTDTATVTVATVAPIVLSAGEDVLVCPGDVVNLMSTITGGLGPFVYSWNTLAGTDSLQSTNGANTSLLPVSGGLFQVSVVDACGNTGSDEVIVAMQPGCELNIPNIITPDGKGAAQNEIFFVENLDKFPGSGLQIYNRWGTKIYESSDYHNDWHGAGHSEGTYYYILTVPVSGTVKAKANKTSADSGTFKETTGDTEKVFTGFFMLGGLK